MNDAHFVITEQRQKINLSVKRKEEKLLRELNRQ